MNKPRLIDANAIVILKKALADYKELCEEVECNNKKTSLPCLCEKLKGHNLNDYRFDVNYKSICVTVSEASGERKVLQNIDIWDDEQGICLGEDLTINDIKKIIEERK